MQQMQLQNPNHIISLQTSAILVCVRTSVYTGKKSDKGMGDKISHDEGAKTNVLNVSHDLFAGDASLKALLNYRQAVYNWLQVLTYDWAGDLRLLPMTNHARFMKEYQQHVDRFEKLKENFFQNYDDRVADAAFVRGPMFNRNDYPDVTHLNKRFSISLDTFEIPSGDFRVSISQDLVDDMKNNFQQQVDRYMNNLDSARIDKLVDVLSAISRTCETETKTMADGSLKIVRKRLYDSTIEKAIALCDEYKNFNPTDNAKLEDARVALESVLSGISVDVLRESDSMRAHMKTSVDDILSRFV